jgi:hypothetical protein
MWRGQVGLVGNMLKMVSKQHCQAATDEFAACVLSSHEYDSHLVLLSFLNRKWLAYQYHYCITTLPSYIYVIWVRDACNPLDQTSPSRVLDHPWRELPLPLIHNMEEWKRLHLDFMTPGELQRHVPSNSQLIYMYPHRARQRIITSASSMGTHTVDRYNYGRIRFHYP